MTTIIFVFVAGWLGGMGLSYIMMAGIIQAARRGEGYPAIRTERPPIPVCHPDRHSQLTGANQEATQGIRPPAPVVATVGRYNVIDKFAYLEVRE